MKHAILILFLLTLMTSSLFSQTLPTTINYQGVLKTVNGTTVPNGNYNVEFFLYDAETGGGVVWQEGKIINVTDGIINTELGSINPFIIPFDKPYWLGIKIESGSELVPRVKLTSVPYSLMSLDVMNESISTSKIQNWAVTSGKIHDEAIISSKILDGSIMAQDIGSYEVVKKVNGIRDSVNLVAGSNIILTPSGNSITINALGGGSGNLSGSGAINYISKFVGNSTIGNSLIYESGNGDIGIGTTTPTAKLELVGGDALINGLTIGIGNGLINTNTAIGFNTLHSNSTGMRNTAVGDQTLYYNTTGFDNTSVGYQCLYRNNNGNGNTGLGSLSLAFNTSGINNTAVGVSSLLSNTTGEYNTAIGTLSLFRNVTNSGNTAIGYGAMQYIDNNITSPETYNTAVGFEAMRGNANPTGYSGTFNTSLGAFSLNENVSGGFNTAVGSLCLRQNTEGNYNTGVGYSSLSLNTTGNNNTAAGYSALSYNITGKDNTATGSAALHLNSEGSYNTAIGSGSLSQNNTGSYNTACGERALQYGYTGDGNTALGSSSLFYNSAGDYNTAVGMHSLLQNSTGENNTAVGSSAGREGNQYNSTFIGSWAYAFPGDGLVNTTGIGYDARPTTSYQVVLGSSAVTQIGGYVNWSNFSDGRYKSAVSENVRGLDFIMKLRPITYRLNMDKLAANLHEDEHSDQNKNIVNSLDVVDAQGRNKKSQINYTGFIAQEVERAAQETGYDFSGVVVPKTENEFYGLRYAEFVVPLVKAVQEQQKIIEALTRRIEELEKR